MARRLAGLVGVACCFDRDHRGRAAFREAGLCGRWRAAGNGGDERAFWEARVLLRDVGARRAGVGAGTLTAEECPRIPREFLEEERASMGDRWFRQEYLCCFEDAVSCV